MKHLLLFTIGPVQGFIAQARKTHDLYAGSRLLSDLIKAAIGAAGGKLIFPYLGDAMPNRFLMEVPENENNLLAYGQKVENSVRNKWLEIAFKSLGGIPKPAGFDEQIQSHLEIFWVVGEAGPNYVEAVKQLEKELAAIKNVRPFQQYGWQGIAGEKGRKCALDGQRNVQFYCPSNGKSVKPTDSPLYSTMGGVTIQKFQPNEMQPGEGLSAVSFVKRKYSSSPFDSTAEIALLDALNFLKDKKKNIASCIRLKEFENAFDGFNAQLYYEEGLSEQFLEKQGITYDRPLYELKRIRKECLEDFARENGFKFQKYYAILTFDGDDMGKWLAGEGLKDKQQLQSFQTEFAKCLGGFAEAAKKRLLDDRSGQTVYAGGDDFLGFVNLNHLLPVLKDLRSMFREKVNKPLAPFTTKEITFSAGICVSHYKEPLSLVLQEANNAQKKAKDFDGKDAFAISVIKGSGESHCTVLPFGEKEENVESISTLTNALILEKFSNNFIKTLRLEFERVMDFYDDPTSFEQVFEAELNRLLLRGWSKEEKKQAAKEMTEMLMTLYSMRKTDNFFQMLHIADFFQREMDTPQKQENKTETV